MTYSSQGEHKGRITAQLYVFSPEDDYAIAKYYYSVNDSGNAFWGRNKPFETALKKSLLRMYWSFSRIMEKGIGRDISIDNVLHDEKYFECNSKAYLIEPEFTKATFDYNPTESEKHDFPRFLANKFGKLLNKDTRLLTNEEQEKLKDCNTSTIITMKFNMPEASVNITIQDGVETITSPFNKEFTEIDVVDWNENHIFMKGLRKLLIKIKKDYESR